MLKIYITSWIIMVLAVLLSNLLASSDKLYVPWVDDVSELIKHRLFKTNQCYISTINIPLYDWVWTKTTYQMDIHVR